MHHHIRIDLDIVFAAGWHAGSGEGSFSTDRLVSRNPQNHPFLPASTLKGVVRQSCEKVSRTLGFPPPSDPHQSDLTRNQAFVPFHHLQSPIDQIFGTKYASGGLFFRDAHPQPVPPAAAVTVSRHRTARYRVLQTVREQHLFSTEYSPATLVLSSRIDGWHQHLVYIDAASPPYAYCLLMAGILAVDRLGGDKSTGAGWLHQALRVTRVTWNQQSLAPEDFLDIELLNYEDYLEMQSEQKGAA